MFNKIFYLNDIKKLSNFTEKFNYLDVGSRGGIDGWFSIIHEKLNLISFEAEEGNALFNIKGRKKFYLTKNKGNSSFFRPNDKNKIFENEEGRINFEEIEINTDTIDNIIIDKIDLIKIDTQGSEYEIIEGGWKKISNDMPFLFLETWSDYYYENIRLFNEIITKLRTIGYEIYLLDVAGANRIDLRHKFSKNIGQQKFVGFNLFLGPNLDYLISIKNLEERIKRSFILFVHDLLTYSYKIVEKDNCDYKLFLEKIINKRIKYRHFYFILKYLKLARSLFLRKRKYFYPLT
jgi:hypothetical protein